MFRLICVLAGWTGQKVYANHTIVYFSICKPTFSLFEWLAYMHLAVWHTAKYWSDWAYWPGGWQLCCKILPYRLNVNRFVSTALCWYSVCAHVCIVVFISECRVYCICIVVFISECHVHCICLWIKRTFYCLLLFNQTASVSQEQIDCFSVTMNCIR